MELFVVVEGGGGTGQSKMLSDFSHLAQGSTSKG